MQADVVQAHAQTLGEWAEAWAREQRATGGDGEVVMLLRRCANAMRRTLDPDMPGDVEELPRPVEAVELRAG